MRPITKVCFVAGQEEGKTGTGSSRATYTFHRGTEMPLSLHTAQNSVQMMHASQNREGLRGVDTALSRGK